jgi:hypothetical protein
VHNGIDVSWQLRKEPFVSEVARDKIESDMLVG